MAGRNRGAVLTRHKWSAESRTYGSYRAFCERCHLVRDRRFCYGRHWTEYDRDGVTIASTAYGEKAPPCEPIPANAEATA